MSGRLQPLLDRVARNGRARNALLAPAIAVGLATFVFCALLISAGKPPIGTMLAILNGAFGSRLSILETLTRATPLLLCALAVAVPARAGMFNIGGEGQLHAGAIAATAVALCSAHLPGLFVIPVMIGAGMLAGAAWGAVPGVLRARLGVNEVLVSLMLNYVAIFLVEYLVHGPWKDPSALGWPYSAQFPPSAVLPTWGRSNVHLGLLIGLVLAVAAFVLMRTTTWGFAVRVVDANPAAARYAGIRTARYITVLMLIGGAMAAIAGVGEVSVIQGRLRSGISPGYGYTGFVVSWLAGNNFLAIIPVAVLIGGLYAGSDAIQLSASLPSSTGDIFMGLVFLAFLFSNAIADKLRSVGAAGTVR